ncbi:MAG TPA: ribose-phosphate pyrophosphokinase [Azospirillum sp.]|nr:ribose-phosphate pyrophosphokinase [Azospirillum sp.]
MPNGELLLFALESSRALGERIAGTIGQPLSAHEERAFEDGEHKSRPLVNVRGGDVYVIASLHASTEETVNDRLCRLLFFLGALRDAGAARLTAVLPYLCYARKDRKTKDRDPVTTRYVAQMIEAVGVDCVLTIDVHNLAAYQNAFRCRSEHLEAAPLLVPAIVAALPPEQPVVVCSPDAGGFKRAEGFRRRLETRTGRPVELALMEKQRSQGEVTGTRFFGTVDGSTVVIVDDLISTGTTMSRAARASRVEGARAVIAAATHGTFTGKAAEAVADPAIDRFIVTDTIPPFRLPPDLVARKLTIVGTAAFLAEAIGRLHDGGSLEDLMAEN